MITACSTYHGIISQYDINHGRTSISHHTYPFVPVGAARAGLKGSYIMEAQEQYRSAELEKPDNQDAWTSGEWIGEGQGGGPRHDTGRFHARQWVGNR
jgi:hypothetical protein